ncbi:hypothetical protein JW933_05260 [candidate division FCPU426 bacterium]|nr:hypothetical protein [candidate division FCPU426 bacterium]
MGSLAAGRAVAASSRQGQTAALRLQQPADVHILTGRSFANMLQTVFLLSGFMSVIAQTVLLREMLVVFQGNELSVGIMLSQWLLGVAAGSYLAGAGMDRKGFPLFQGLTASFVLTGGLLMAGLVFIRHFRFLVHVFPGEGLSLFHVLWGSVAVFLPLSIVIGAQFVFGVRWAEQKQHAYPASAIYLWEATGYLLGGMIHTFLLLTHVAAFSIGGALFSLGVACLAVLVRSRRAKGIAWAGVLMSVLATVCCAPWAEEWSAARLYAPNTLLAVQNSPHGQHAVAEKDQSQIFLIDGNPVLTFPHPDQTRIEENVHLPLLFHPRPREALLLGSAGLYLPAMLAHPLAQLDYAEADPYFIRFMQKYAPAQYAACLHDPRLTIHYQDGRAFLDKTSRTYDVILLGFHLPATLADNRFFTVEFFRSVRRTLKSGGIVVLTLPGSLVYLNRELAEINRILLATLQSVFPAVQIVPGEENLLIAFNTSRQPETPEAVKKRFYSSALECGFLSEKYLDYRLDPGKYAWLQEQLGPAAAAKKENRDFIPRCLTASLLYWQEMFAPGVNKVYVQSMRFSWLLWLLLLLWLLRGRVGAYGTMFASGGAGMGLHMLSLWSLQLRSGALYLWIGMLNAVFMAGIAAGAFYFRRLAQGGNQVRRLRWLEFLFVGWIVIGWVLFIPGLPWQACFAVSAGSGFFVGLEFPTLAAFLTSEHQAPESRIAGPLYAADVLGGWLAALLLGALWIPTWGFSHTLLLLLGVKGATAWWWMRKASPHGSG